MNKKDMIDTGMNVMKQWEERVHALITEYRKLEQKVKQKGEKINNKKLLREAKKNMKGGKNVKISTKNC